MIGAEALVRTLLASEVEACFANPGTSEMHFVAALDRAPGLRCVLGLAETVVTGCTDGYGRMAGKPAATLLHCGPGLANGLANLHNARRARSGIVNIVGDQATYHRPLDAPLTADAEGWARPVSAWVRTSTAADKVGGDAAAFAIDEIVALSNNGGSPADVAVAIADVLGDIIVYCRSEALKYGIPLEEVLDIIMDSNESKLDADGKPIYDANGKFLKGPDRKSTRLNSSHMSESRMPSSA